MPGTTARLNGWFRKLAAAASAKKVSPQLVATTLQLLGAPDAAEAAVVEEARASQSPGSVAKGTDLADLATASPAAADSSARSLESEANNFNPFSAEVNWGNGSDKAKESDEEYPGPDEGILAADLAAGVVVRFGVLLQYHPQQIAAKIFSKQSVPKEDLAAQGLFTESELGAFGFSFAAAPGISVNGGQGSYLRRPEPAERPEGESLAARAASGLGAAMLAVLLAVASSLPAVQAFEDLSPAESQTVDLFQQNTPGVVYITTEVFQLSKNARKMEIQAVPKGEGSGWVGLPGGGYGFFPSKGLPPKIFPQRSAIAFAYGKSSSAGVQGPARVFVLEHGGEYDLLVPGALKLNFEASFGMLNVYDNEGHIVTNYHVIENASFVTVKFIEGTEVVAKVVGADPYSDVAVLQADLPPNQLKMMQPLTRGNSASLRVGQEVFAIGNPFGLDHTLTKGIVSGVGRTIQSTGGRPIQGAIQTDASINPGPAPELAPRKRGPAEPE
ncbi:unnamed protein product [Effrenium voratum]|nr:unnamed protein product [Effrenium voratum]